MNYQDMIRELSVPVAPSGFETPVTEKLEELLSGKGLQITRSALGNLIVHRPGKSVDAKKIALVAHADTRGFVVLSEDNGRCRIGDLGHHNAASCIGLPVRFANGAKGIIGCDGGFKADCTVKDLFIDLTAGSVTLGDVCVAALPTYSEEDRVISPALDSRAACAVLLDVLDRAQTDADLWFVFSVQHELGQRGAASALFDVHPDLVLVCECVPTTDMPDCPVKCKVKLGDGAIVPIKIGRGASDLTLAAALEAVSDVPPVRAVYPEGQTDLSPIQVAGIGVRSCAVGIPCRRYGELGVALASDMEKTADLLALAVAKL